jgi:tetratricopeptide (TPR) repeat protein
LSQLGSGAEGAIPRAQSLMAVGRHPEAVEILRSAVASEPQNPDLACLLGAALLRVGKPAESLQMARSAAAIAPESEWPFRVMAYALIRLHKRKEALAAAQQAMRLDPTELLVMQVNAEAQLACGKAADAEATASRLIELYPESASGFELGGRASLRRKRYAEAESRFREALRLEPDDWTLNNNLGVALQRQKKNKEAIQAFERAAKANPTAKLPQQNLFGAANSYVRAGGAFFAAFLLLRLLPAIGKATHLSDGLIFAILAVAIVALFTSFWFIRRRRRQQLGPTVEAFYQHEGRRYRNTQLMYVAFRWGPLLLIAIALLGLGIAEIPEFGSWFVAALVVMTAWFALSPFIWRRTLLRRLMPED